MRLCRGIIAAVNRPCGLIQGLKRVYNWYAWRFNVVKPGVRVELNVCSRIIEPHDANIREDLVPAAPCAATVLPVRFGRCIRGP